MTFIIKKNGKEKIKPGRRYHARITHEDGRVEHVLLTAEEDAAGEQFLAGENGARERVKIRGGNCLVEIIGRVIARVNRER